MHQPPSPKEEAAMFVCYVLFALFFGLFAIGKLIQVLW